MCESLVRQLVAQLGSAQFGSAQFGSAQFGPENAGTSGVRRVGGMTRGVPQRIWKQMARVLEIVGI